METLTQICIVIFGGLAVALLSHKDKKLRRWGYISALCGEPFWCYTAIVHRQWGILIICIWYAAWWGVGIKNHWLSK